MHASSFNELCHPAAAALQISGDFENLEGGVAAGVSGDNRDWMTVNGKGRGMQKHPHRILSVSMSVGYKLSFNPLCWENERVRAFGETEHCLVLNSTWRQQVQRRNPQGIFRPGSDTMPWRSG